MHEGLQGVLDSTKESTTAEIAHLTAVSKVTTQPSMHGSSCSTRQHQESTTAEINNTQPSMHASI